MIQTVKKGQSRNKLNPTIQTTTTFSQRNGEDSYDSSQRDKEAFIFQWVVWAVLCQAVDIFGIGSNIINIMCFVKQGFKDPVNVSLLGLAVSDLGCLLTLVFTNLCYTPAFSALDLPFNPSEFQYLTSGMTHVAFSRVSSWITAFITLERCVCIALPLKVKDLITTKRVSIIVTTISMILLASASPVFVVNKLDWKFYPDSNKTLIGLITFEHSQIVDMIIYVINNVIIPFGAFLIIIVCTAILVVKLRKTAQLRHQLGASDKLSRVSTSNQRVAKMVMMISILFISCFIPVSIMFVAMSLVPDFSIDGKYKNMLIIIGGLCGLLESINSAVNIFIYYTMSSRYREAFHQLFSSAR